MTSGKAGDMACVILLFRGDALSGLQTAFNRAFHVIRPRAPILARKKDSSMILIQARTMTGQLAGTENQITAANIRCARPILNGLE